MNLACTELNYSRFAELDSEIGFDQSTPAHDSASREHTGTSHLRTRVHNKSSRSVIVGLIYFVWCRNLGISLTCSERFGKSNATVSQSCELRSGGMGGT